MNNTQTETQTPKTWRDHLKALGGAMILVFGTVALIEFLLALVDPWGMHYFVDLAKMGNETFVADDERGYIIPDGTHNYTRWTASIEDGARVLPDQIATSDANCRIAILGDSVAFGYGVNDTDVWLNDLAQQFPDVYFANYGVPRYNSTNVLMTYNTIDDYNGYLYLIINNDLQPALDVENEVFAGSGESLLWIMRYINFAVFRGNNTGRPATLVESTAMADPDDPTVQRFLSEVTLLDEQEQVAFVAFEYEPTTNTLVNQDFDLTVLSYPPDRISFADYHLNPAGNDKLAQAISPTIQELINTACVE